MFPDMLELATVLFSDVLNSKRKVWKMMLLTQFRKLLTFILKQVSISGQYGIMAYSIITTI